MDFVNSSPLVRNMLDASAYRNVDHGFGSYDNIPGETLSALVGTREFGPESCNLLHYVQELPEVRQGDSVQTYHPVFHEEKPTVAGKIRK